MKWDAVIVGSGVVGLNVAWRLAQLNQGHVLLIDSKFPASGATGLGTGSVHVQRWNETDVSLVMRSKQIMADLSEKTNGAFRFYPVGRLTIVGEQDRATLESHAGVINEMGGELETLDPDELEQRFSKIDFSGIALGTYTPNDGYVYPPALAWTTAGVVRDCGVTIWEGVPVERIDTNEDGSVRGVVLAHEEVIQCEKVVLTAGIWTQKLLRASGLDLPVKQSATQSAVIIARNVSSEDLLPSVLDGNQDMLTIPRNPGTIVAGGRWGEGRPEPININGDISSEFSEIEDEYLESLYPYLYQRFPGYDLGPIIGGWGGLVDTTPDDNPFIGSYDGVEGLWVACGLSGYGIQRGPAVGEVIADSMAGLGPSVDTSDYRVNRYPSGYDFDAERTSGWSNPFEPANVER